jgi:hypothetical protein
VFFWAEIEDNPSLLDKPYSPFHVEYGTSSKFGFGDFIPRDDMLLCDVMDHSLSLPMIGIQFSYHSTGFLIH